VSQLSIKCGRLDISQPVTGITLSSTVTTEGIHIMYKAYSWGGGGGVSKFPSGTRYNPFENLTLSKYTVHRELRKLCLFCINLKRKHQMSRPVSAVKLLSPLYNNINRTYFSFHSYKIVEEMFKVTFIGV
jgi:hypothetical protein